MTFHVIFDNMKQDRQKLSAITKDIKDLCVKHGIAALMYPELIKKDHPQYEKLEANILMNFFLLGASEDQQGALLTPSDLVDHTKFKFFQDHTVTTLYYISKIGVVENAKYPTAIQTGYSQKGIITSLPTVGESFYIGSMYTSTVTELLDDESEIFTFKTMNSIYRLSKVK